MNYIKDLVPEKHRVDITAYKIIIDDSSIIEKSVSLSKIFIVIGILSTFISYYFTLFFLYFGIIINCKITNYIEKILRFTFNIKMKLISSLILLIFCSISFFKENDLKKQLELEKFQKKQIEIEEQNRAKALIEQQYEIEKKIIEPANIALANKSYKKALTLYDNINITDNRILQVLYFNKGICFKESRQYDSAIIYFSKYLNENTYIEIGKCYEQKKDIKNALNYYKKAGNYDARVLYDKLNPEKKRFSYYQTMCCDGTASPSNAKGRGACSHHGGVCNWNEPIYKTYKEYPDFDSK